MSADNWTKCPKCGQDFREDYEIGIDCNTGVFDVYYSGNCSECDFVHKFNKHEELKEATK